MATVKLRTISTASVAVSSLSDRDLLDMYRQMVLVRTLDERIWMLNRQGKAAIVASSQGHEAGQIGSVWALECGVDQFYIYYRDLAVMLTLGMTPVRDHVRLSGQRGRAVERREAVPNPWGVPGAGNSQPLQRGRHANPAGGGRRAGHEDARRSRPGHNLLPGTALPASETATRR